MAQSMKDRMAERGLTERDAKRAESARRAQRTRELRNPKYLIPGVPSHYVGIRREGPSWRSTDRDMAREEQAALEACAPGRERTREYVRIFERINHLVCGPTTFAADAFTFEEAA